MSYSVTDYARNKRQDFCRDTNTVTRFFFKSSVAKVLLAGLGFSGHERPGNSASLCMTDYKRMGLYVETGL